MSEIKKAEFGYTLPKERWVEAAENVQEMGNQIAAILLKRNADGMGKQDAEEWLADVLLAYTALRYVAEFATDKCRMVPLPSKRRGGKEWEK